MKQSLLTLIALAIISSAASQTQGVAFSTVGKGVATPFVTDYHCLGINVSGLGWGTGYKGKRFTVGSTEFGAGIYSETLTADKLRNLSRTLYNRASKKDNSQINYQQQLSAAGDYAESGVAIFVDFNWAGLAFQSPKLGGIAFNIRENYQWYSKLNRQTSDLIFRGKFSSYFDSLTVAINGDTSVIANHGNISQDTLSNVILGNISVPLRISQITNGSSIKMVWNRSYNIGYGRKIIGKDSVFAIYGGIGARIIQSMAMFDLESSGNGVRIISSITPAFKIDYGNISGTNTMSYKGGIPPAVGNGYGIDLSASAILFRRLRVAVAVNNIGAVTYTHNVYSVRDTLVGNISLNGLDEMNITKSVNQLVRDGGILKLEGKEKIHVANAADFRFGASFQPIKQLRIGFDMVAPFNKENPGSIQNAVFSFGGDFTPVKWIALNLGYYGGGIYKHNIPVGVTFILKNGGYEFGIASRDALTFLTKKTHSISTAFGFARFRF